MTILLVEDSKFLRLANERMLTKAGYEVISAGDGEAALRVALERIPNLILLDMMIPKLDGPDERPLEWRRLHPEIDPRLQQSLRDGKYYS